MYYGKDFFASKTTWGAIVLLIGPALRLMGLEFDSQALVDSLATVAGFATILWGQFTRKKEITSVAGVQVKP